MLQVHNVISHPLSHVLVILDNQRGCNVKPNVCCVFNVMKTALVCYNLLASYGRRAGPICHHWRRIQNWNCNALVKSKGFLKENILQKKTSSSPLYLLSRVYSLILKVPNIQIKATPPSVHTSPSIHISILQCTVLIHGFKNCLCTQF